MTPSDPTIERTPEESRSVRRAFILKTLESFRGLSDTELRRRMLDPALVKKRLGELDQMKARESSPTES